MAVPACASVAAAQPGGERDSERGRDRGGVQTHGFGSTANRRPSGDQKTLQAHMDSFNKL